jgi:predicted DsbA family dithiol-disulfide isomerase
MTQVRVLRGRATAACYVLAPNAMTVTLTVFTDFICPWCYLSTPRTARLAREYDVALEYVHFPLHPGLPAEGTTLQKLFAGRGLDVSAMQSQMAARMKAEGLEFSPTDRVSNSRRAQELSAWALSKGVSLVDALYRANFVDDVNLSDAEALVDIAARHGLDRAEALRAIDERAGREAIDAQWSEARELGVSGVPTFVAGQHGVVGAQPYAELVKLVERAGAKRRSA